jgi:two-component system LytT family sensor kinase
LHPAAFLAGWLALGALFALQEYVSVRSWNREIGLGILLLAWGVHFLLWGIICQTLWWRLPERIVQADLKYILLRIVPLSIVLSVLEEAIWVACSPYVPIGHHNWTYLHRLHYYLDSELVDNLVIFWVAFGMFRGIGYYERSREQEYAAVVLESELVNAQLRALRMQLNPHFLFNTMNSISSLMRSDVERADQMLEQMCSMLRMTLDRGDAKLIPLTEEIDFIHLYISIQRARFEGVVHHYVAIAPEVLDALVPTMILQPIVENAYAHGVRRTIGEGFLGIEAQQQDGKLRICVRNSGRGLGKSEGSEGDRIGVGISNTKSRLQLQYGGSQQFSLREFENGEVQAVLLLPLEYGERLTANSDSSLYETQDSYRR